MFLRTHTLASEQDTEESHQVLQKVETWIWSLYEVNNVSRLYVFKSKAIQVEDLSQWASQLKEALTVVATETSEISHSPEAN